MADQRAGYAPEERDAFVAWRLRDPKSREIATSLIQGVMDNRERIDEAISRLAQNWRLDRMAAIDRNVLRVGSYELLFCPDIPVRVAINEAVELAKRYGSAQSGRFVNGILNQLQHDREAPGRTASRDRNAELDPAPAEAPAAAPEPEPEPASDANAQAPSPEVDPNPAPPGNDPGHERDDSTDGGERPS